MNRLAKFFWILSIIFFLVTLLFVYAYLPQRVAVQAGPGTVADEFISRAAFFYISLGIFLFANVPIFVLRKLLQKTAIQAEREGRWSAARISLREDLANWLLGFAAALNIFFITGMAYVGVFNSPEDIDMGLYAPLVYIGPLLIAILFVVLIYIFLKKRPA